MHITVTIKTDKTLTKEQISELNDSVRAYAEEIIDDLTFLDEEDDDEIDSKPKPKKKATPKKKVAPDD